MCRNISISRQVCSNIFIIGFVCKNICITGQVCTNICVWLVVHNTNIKLVRCSEQTVQVCIYIYTYSLSGVYILVRCVGKERRGMG
jgi:hypothetical protein